MFDFNIQIFDVLLLVFSGIFTGILASMSITTKVIKTPLTIKNTNHLLSLYITLGFFSIFGILILSIMNFGLIHTGLIGIVSFIIYYFFHKLNLNINFPKFLDVILYFWTLFIFHGLVRGLVYDWKFISSNSELYSIGITILILISILIINFFINKKPPDF